MAKKPLLSEMDIKAIHKEDRSYLSKLRLSRNKLKTLQTANMERPELVAEIKSIGRLVKRKHPVTHKEMTIFGESTIELLASAVPTSQSMVKQYIKRGLILKPKDIRTPKMFEISVQILQIEETKTTNLAQLKRRIEDIERDNGKETRAETWKQSMLHIQILDEKKKRTSLSSMIVPRKNLYALALATVTPHLLPLIPSADVFHGVVLNRWIERGTFPKPTTIASSHTFYNPKALAQIIQINLEIQQGGGSKSLDYPYQRMDAKRLFPKTRFPKARNPDAVK